MRFQMMRRNERPTAAKPTMDITKT